MNGSNFLTVAQAATELDVTRQAVQQMIDEKRIHALWLLERWAIPEAEVIRVRNERERNRQTKVA